MEDQKEIEELYKIINPRQIDCGESINSLLMNTAQLVILSGYRKPAPEKPINGGYFGTHCHICHEAVGDCGCVRKAPESNLSPLDFHTILDVIDIDKPFKKIDQYYKNKLAIELCERFGVPSSPSLELINIDRLIKECGCSTIQAMIINSKFGTPSLPSEDLQRLDNLIHWAKHQKQDGAMVQWIELLEKIHRLLEKGRA